MYFILLFCFFFKKIFNSWPIFFLFVIYIGLYKIQRQSVLQYATTFSETIDGEVLEQHVT